MRAVRRCAGAVRPRMRRDSLRPRTSAPATRRPRLRAAASPPRRRRGLGVVRRLQRSVRLCAAALSEARRSCVDARWRTRPTGGTPRKQTHMRARTHTHTHTRARAHAHAHAHTHPHTHKHTLTHRHADTDTHTHTHAHTRAHTHGRVHAHTCTHTHARARTVGLAGPRGARRRRRRRSASRCAGTTKAARHRPMAVYPARSRALQPTLHRRYVYIYTFTRKGRAQDAAAAEARSAMRRIGDAEVRRRRPPARIRVP
jgi:hypothetical protein